MALPGGPEAHIAAKSWVRQLGAGQSLEAHEPRAAARLVSETTKCLKIVLRHTGLPDSEVPVATRKKLQQCYSRLVLWADGYGVEQGELDGAMERSHSLRHAVIETLVSIGKTVLDELADHLRIAEEKIDHGALRAAIQDALFSLDDGYENNTSDEDGGNSDSDAASSPHGTATDLSEALEDLETDTQLLFDLDPLVKSAVPDPVTSETGDGQPVVVEWAPHLVFSDRVSRRFPKADASLIECLAKANLDRFLRARNEREAGRLAQEVSKIAAGAAALLKEPAPGDKSESGTQFHDSGLGTSIATPSSYAETVMSYREGQSSASVRIPPLPGGAKSGKEFECIACGRLLVITNNSEWKRHLFLDLRPWSCLDLSCPSRMIPFLTRNDWVQHLAYDHEMAPEWESIDCPLCFQAIPGGKSAMLRHLGSHLEEISLGSLPACLDPETASESGSVSDSESSSSDVSTTKPPAVDHSKISFLKAWVIRELAVQERHLGELLDRLDIRSSNNRSLTAALGRTRQDAKPRLQTTLEQVARYDTQSQRWSLSEESWKQLDVSIYSESRKEDRQKAIENAIKQYDRWRVGPEDPLWQRLLPLEQRGKGICLSKLKPKTSSEKPSVLPQLRDASPAPALKLANRYHCAQCNDIPEGFQRVEELSQHTATHHQRPSKKKWVCRDPFVAGIPSEAIAVRPLSGCETCNSKKQYGSFHNAVAHLKRMHFTEKNSARKRQLPPVSELKPWVVEITVPELRPTGVPVPQGPPANGSNPRTPMADPVILRLADQAGEDIALRELMRSVATGDATKEELYKFQGVVDRITAEVKKEAASQPKPAV